MLHLLHPSAAQVQVQRINTFLAAGDERHLRRAGSSTRYTPVLHRSKRYGQSPQQHHQQVTSPGATHRRSCTAHGRGQHEHTPRRNAAAQAEAERRHGGDREPRSSGRRGRHGAAGRTRRDRSQRTKQNKSRGEKSRLDSMLWLNDKLGVIPGCSESALQVYAAPARFCSGCIPLNLMGHSFRSATAICLGKQTLLRFFCLIRIHASQTVMSMSFAWCPMHVWRLPCMPCLPCTLDVCIVGITT